MSQERRKSVWPWIVAVLIGLPALYVASFGPVCWWISPKPPTGAPRTPIDNIPHVSHFFWPVGWVATHSPNSVYRAIGWYATRRAPIVQVPADRAGTTLAAFYADPAGLQTQPEA